MENKEINEESKEIQEVKEEIQEIKESKLEQPQKKEELKKPQYQIENITNQKQNENKQLEDNVTIRSQSSYCLLDVSNASLFTIQPTKIPKKVHEEKQTITTQPLPKTAEIPTITSPVTQQTILAQQQTANTGNTQPNVNQLFMDYNYQIMNNYYPYMSPSAYYQYQYPQGRGTTDYTQSYANYTNYLMYLQMLQTQRMQNYYHQRKNYPTKQNYQMNNQKEGGNNKPESQLNK